ALPISVIRAGDRGLELPANRRALLEHGNGRKTLALEELEEGAAAGGDIRDPVADAELLDGCERIAAARDRERVARRDGLGDAARAGREFRMLEHADRAVPDDRAGLREPSRVRLRRARTDVEDHVARADAGEIRHSSFRVRLETGPDDDVGRQRNLGLAE